mgnify:CR=1 FL=1
MMHNNDIPLYYNTIIIFSLIFTVYYPYLVSKYIYFI